MAFNAIGTPVSAVTSVDIPLAPPKAMPPSLTSQISEYAGNFFNQVAQGTLKIGLRVTGVTLVTSGVILLIPSALTGAFLVGPANSALYGAGDSLGLLKFDDTPMSSRAGASHETPYSAGFKLSLVPALFLLGSGGVCLQKGGLIN